MPRGKASQKSKGQNSKVLGIDERTVRALIREKVIPAEQVIKFAPWQIRSEALEKSSVLERVRRIKTRDIARMANGVNRDTRRFYCRGWMSCVMNWPRKKTDRVGQLAWHNRHSHGERTSHSAHSTRSVNSTAAAPGFCTETEQCTIEEKRRPRAGIP